MNPLCLIDEFLQRAALDDRITSLHISLYAAIFQRWNAAGAHSPVRATRLSLMQVSKIGSKGTYHRCISDLENYGYIHYQGSNHPIEGRLIGLTRTESGTTSDELTRTNNGTSIKSGTTSEAVSSTEYGTTSVDFTRTENGTSTKSGTTKTKNLYQIWDDLIEKTPIQNTHSTDETMPYYTKENSLRDGNTGYNPIDVWPGMVPEKPKKVSRTKSGTSKKTTKKSPSLSNIYNNIYNNIERGGEKKEVVPKMVLVPKVGRVNPPELLQVIELFSAKKLPVVEAEKFFNYYQSNGWMVGKNPMKNWQAAARNWILKMGQFSNTPSVSAPVPGSLHATTDKDYSEPL